MITVKLSDDGKSVVLDASDMAEAFVGLLAAAYAEHPASVGLGLKAIADRRRTWEGLASLEEARDLPEHLVEGALAAYDEACQTFVAEELAGPVEYAMGEAVARRLAVDLSRHAGLATAACIRSGGALWR